MFADKMKAFDNVKQIFIEVMEKNIAFLQSSPVDLFDVVKEYINTIRKIDTIEIADTTRQAELNTFYEEQALHYLLEKIILVRHQLCM